MNSPLINTFGKTSLVLQQGVTASSGNLNGFNRFFSARSPSSATLNCFSFFQSKIKMAGPAWSRNSKIPGNRGQPFRLNQLEGVSGFSVDSLIAIEKGPKQLGNRRACFFAIFPKRNDGPNSNFDTARDDSLPQRRHANIWRYSESCEGTCRRFCHIPLGKTRKDGWHNPAFIFFDGLQACDRLHRHLSRCQWFESICSRADQCGELIRLRFQSFKCRKGVNRGWGRPALYHADQVGAGRARNRPKNMESFHRPLGLEERSYHEHFEWLRHPARMFRTQEVGFPFGFVVVDPLDQ
jgi:hypothetical protein